MSLQAISRAGADLEARRRARAFTRTAMFLAQANAEGKGGFATALKNAENSRAAPLIVEALKAGVTAGNTTDWSALAEFQQLSNPWQASLKEFGCFDQMMALDVFKRVPVHVWVVMSTSVATADAANEGAAKAITKWSLDRAQLAEKKVLAQVVTTQEVMKFSSAAALSSIDAELRKAAAIGADEVFIDALKNFPPIWTNASTGLTTTAFLSDLSGALLALTLGADSKVFLIASPSTISVLALLHDSNFMFPNLGILGGSIQDIQVLASDAAGDDIIVCDASQIVVGDNPRVVIDQSGQATLQLDSTPTSGSSSQVSLWQNNLIAIRCERRLAVQPLHASSIALITGVTSVTA